MDKDAQIVLMHQALERVLSCSGPHGILHAREVAGNVLAEIDPPPVIKNALGRVLSATEVSLAHSTGSYRSPEELRRDYDMQGRRYILCTNAGNIRDCIEKLDTSTGIKRELANMMNAVLRMALVINDGQVSEDQLNSF